MLCHERSADVCCYYVFFTACSLSCETFTLDASAVCSAYLTVTLYEVKCPFILFVNVSSAAFLCYFDSLMIWYVNEMLLFSVYVTFDNVILLLLCPCLCSHNPLCCVLVGFVSLQTFPPQSESMNTSNTLHAYIPFKAQSPETKLGCLCWTTNRHVRTTLILTVTHNFHVYFIVNSIVVHTVCGWSFTTVLRSLQYKYDNPHTPYCLFLFLLYRAK